MGFADFHGVAVAAVTPFTERGKVDAPLLADLIEWWISQGVQAVVACGSTGETAYLQPDERLRVIEAAVRACAGRARLWAGTGFPDTPTTIEVTREAGALGAEAALVVTPFYYPLSQATLIDHYGEVAEAAALPVLLYNMPPLTHVDLSAESVVTLSRLDGIVGVKDSAGDMDQLKAIVDRTPDDFCTLTGSFPKLVEAMAVGANGAILAMANLIPQACVDIRALAADGRMEEARALIAEFDHLRDWIKRHGIPGIKHKLNEWRHPAGWPRRPLRSVGAAPQTSIDEPTR